MSYQIPFSNTQLDKAMTTEQFNQIVEAILAGKYSWACVLILRFAGYNPLHYIPYRTYNRLIKDNYQLGRKNKENINPANESISQVNFQDVAVQKSSRKISDLSYLETANEPYSKVHGGNRSLWELDPFLSVSSFGF